MDRHNWPERSDSENETGPDSRIPKRVIGITQQGWEGRAGKGWGGAREGFFFFLPPKLPRAYYGFQDMVFGTWDLNFGAWEILEYSFQNMVFKTWDFNFGAWEILEYSFQNMVFKTWDLNFGAWIFTLAVSKTET
jgi:hypothetical protein